MRSGSSMNHRRLLGSLLLIATAASHTANCSITTLSGLSFGAYDPFSAVPLDSAATAQVTCSTGSMVELVNFTFSLGTGISGSHSPRQMRTPLNNRLDYNVYTDAARTQVFGNGSPGTTTFSGSTLVFRNSPRVLTQNLYGRIGAGQDASVGAYSDTLIYTIVF
jgi:spore coat protein U-like protein